MADPQLCYGGVRILNRPCLSNIRRLDLGALPMIQEFHRNGVYLHTPVLDSLTTTLLEKETETRAAIASLIPPSSLTLAPELNWNSSPQVSTLLFKELRLKPAGRPRLTETGQLSTDDEVLSQLRAQYPTHPVIGLIIDGRRLTKLRTTYAQKLPLMRDPDGRIRGEYSYTRTDTGRLAMSNPSLQQIPVRTELGTMVRQAFTTQDCREDRTLASLDFSQIEMLSGADMSLDQVMLDCFRRGGDIHTETAVSVFQLEDMFIALALKARFEEDGLEPGWAGDERNQWKAFKQEYRLVAKQGGFAVLYGQTPPGLQDNIVSIGGPLWPVPRLEKFIADWFRRYNGVARWLESQWSRSRIHGLVWDPFGRIRRIPEALSRVNRVMRQGFRQAGNMPIQSFAGGLLKLAMAQGMSLVAAYRAAYPNCICLPLLQVHDELIFELSRDIAAEFTACMRAIMEGVARLAVPIHSSAVMAQDWGGLKG